MTNEELAWKLRAKWYHLPDDTFQAWEKVPYDASIDWLNVATRARELLTPEPAIRLGGGLSDAQKAWPATLKMVQAHIIDNVTQALRAIIQTDGGPPWFDLAEHLEAQASALRASAEPPIDPRIAVVRAVVASETVARRVLAALDGVGR